MSDVNILICDEDSIWLESVEKYLNTYTKHNVVAGVQTFEKAIETLCDNRIDIILVNINMIVKNRTQLEKAYEILLNRNTKVIIISEYVDEELIKRTISLGISNYVMKSEVLNLPYNNNKALDYKSTMQIIIREYCVLKQKEELSVLTEAEMQVFELIMLDNSTTQISVKLFKTINTVKTQKRTILQKLGVNNVMELRAKYKLMVSFNEMMRNEMIAINGGESENNDEGINWNFKIMYYVNKWFRKR